MHRKIKSSFKTSFQRVKENTKKIKKTFKTLQTEQEQEQGHKKRPDPEYQYYFCVGSKVVLSILIRNFLAKLYSKTAKDQQTHNQD
jgi:hypothetical protein